MSEAAPSSGDGLPLSLQLAVDQACNRFEAAWKSGPPPRPEDFLGGWDGPGRAALLRELVLADSHHRRRRGDAHGPGLHHNGRALTSLLSSLRPVPRSRLIIAAPHPDG